MQKITSIGGRRPNLSVPPTSPNDQHRTLREMDDASGPSAEHALVRLRAASCADDKRLDFEVGGKLDDVAYGMSRDNVSVDFHLILFRRRAGALRNRVRAARGRSGLFTNFFDEFGHVVDLFDRHHVKLGIVFPRDLDDQRQRMKRMLRPVVGM